MTYFKEIRIDRVLDALDVEQIKHPFRRVTGRDIDVVKGLEALRFITPYTRGKRYRKALFVRHYLSTFGSDYSYRMWLVWRKLNRVLGEVETGKPFKSGTYASFRLLMYRLRRLGLIESRKVDPELSSAMCFIIPPDKVCGTFDRHYITLVNRDLLYHIGWLNPQYALYDFPKRAGLVQEITLKGIMDMWREMDERAIMIKETAEPDLREEIERLERMRKMAKEWELEQREKEEIKLKEIVVKKPPGVPAVRPPVSKPPKPPELPPIEKLGGIQGIVVNAETDEPIRGVRVYAAKKHTTTDEKGYYTLTGLPAGMRRVTFSLKGYLKKAEVMKIKEDEILELDTEMKLKVHIFKPTPREDEAIRVFRNLIVNNVKLMDYIEREERGEDYEVYFEKQKVEAVVAELKENFYEMLTNVKKIEGDKRYNEFVEYLRVTFHVDPFTLEAI